MESPATEVSRPELSLMQRLLGIFTSPRAVFTSLDENPRFLGALLVVGVLTGLMGFLLADVQIYGIRAGMEAGGGMEPAKIDQAVKFIGYGLPVGWVLISIVPTFLVAGVLLLIGNVILGGVTTYRKMLSLIAHVGILTIPQLLVKYLLIALRDDMERARFILESGTSLASLVPEKGLLYFILAQLDLFNIWQIGIAVIGMAILARVPTQRAAAGLIGSWVLFSIVLVVIQTLTAGAQG